MRRVRRLRITTLSAIPTGGPGAPGPCCPRCGRPAAAVTLEQLASLLGTDVEEAVRLLSDGKARVVPAPDGVCEACRNLPG